jgi:hypothetical protein
MAHTPDFLQAPPRRIFTNDVSPQRGAGWFDSVTFHLTQVQATAALTKIHWKNSKALVLPFEWIRVDLCNPNKYRTGQKICSHRLEISGQLLILLRQEQIIIFLHSHSLVAYHNRVKKIKNVHWKTKNMLLNYFLYIFSLRSRETRTVWTPAYTPTDRLTSWGVLYHPCTVPVYKLLFIRQ